ncbi:MAG TPA: DUF2063 domain-containing protein [Gammaproteobacteria bacterium]|nr:DUF2063 domain-containing protein [Gammaproteobacteria bacterium]
MSAPDLVKLQAAFKDYLFSGANEAAFTPLIAANNGIDVSHRLDVYRNAYYIRLQEALAHDFPVLLAYMGDVAFGREMAAYLKACPSNSPSLRQFGERLPDYLLEHNTLQVADLARLEWAVLKAFDAADASVLTPEMLQNIPPEHWQDLHFELHPSVSVLDVSAHTYEVWNAHRQQQSLPDQQNNSMVPLLIWRSPGGPTIKTVSIECHGLLVSLRDRLSFAQACEQLAVVMPFENVAQVAARCLWELLRQGCLSKLA